MTIKEAQEAVDRWIKEYGVRYFSELTNMACLTEEVGELARIMARRYGDQVSRRANRTTRLRRWQTSFGCSSALPTKPVSTLPKPCKRASTRRQNATKNAIKTTPNYIKNRIYNI